MPDGFFRRSLVLVFITRSIQQTNPLTNLRHGGPDECGKLLRAPARNTGMAFMRRRDFSLCLLVFNRASSCFQLFFSSVPSLVDGFMVVYLALMCCWEAGLLVGGSFRPSCLIAISIRKKELPEKGSPSISGVAFGRVEESVSTRGRCANHGVAERI